LRSKYIEAVLQKFYNKQEREEAQSKSVWVDQDLVNQYLDDKGNFKTITTTEVLELYSEQ
jgi:hypothetical protein